MTTETDHDSKWLSVARSQAAAASAYTCWRARGRHQAFEAVKLVMTELIQILSFQRPGASCSGVPPNAVYSVKMSPQAQPAHSRAAVVSILFATLSN